MLLSKETYSAFRLYIFCQYLCSLGIEPTTFCAANAMLYHWATETLESKSGLHYVLTPLLSSNIDNVSEITKKKKMQWL